MTRRAVLFSVIAWASGVIAVISLGVVVAGPIITGSGFPDYWSIMAIPVQVVGIAFAVLGVIVARRAPGNSVGPLLGATAVAISLVNVQSIWLNLVVEHIIHVPPILINASQTIGFLFPPIAILLLVFPDGTVTDRRWRWLPPALWIMASVTYLLSFFNREPLNPSLSEDTVFSPNTPDFIQFLSDWCVIPYLALLFITIVVAVRRLRTSEDRVRRQLKWVLFGGTLFLIYPVGCLIEIAMSGYPSPPAATIGAIGLAMLPLGIAIGMLKYDLYDVDRAVAATVSYTIVIVLLGAAFALVVFGVGAVFAGGSVLAAVGATAICALLLGPVHRRVRRVVDRRLYPVRQAGLGAIAGLQRDISVGAAEPEQLEQVLSEALRDPSLRVGYLIPGADHDVDIAGDVVPERGAAPVTLGEERAGGISSRLMSATLLRELATSSATIVQVVRLRLQLTAALRDVEASRARIVRAEDETRRKLERDLHDGAQQRIVSAGMSIRLAQRRLVTDPTEVDGLLEQGVAELTTAVAELRRIAQGIRPGGLDEGLRSAIGSLARGIPIPVDLDIEVEEVPDTVTTTAYYVVSESLANAVKHSGAAGIQVSIRQDEDRLRIVIADDGIGGADARGSGLAGLGDRVAAAGGVLQLRSAVGRGTVVEAVIPCAS